MNDFSKVCPTFACVVKVKEIKESNGGIKGFLNLDT